MLFVHAPSNAMNVQTLFWCAVYAYTAEWGKQRGSLYSKNCKFFSPETCNEFHKMCWGVKFFYFSEEHVGVRIDVKNWFWFVPENSNSGFQVVQLMVGDSL